jgi:hypothetical protein
MRPAVGPGEVGVGDALLGRDLDRRALDALIIAGVQSEGARSDVVGEPRLRSITSPLTW